MIDSDQALLRFSHWPPLSANHAESSEHAFRMIPIMVHKDATAGRFTSTAPSLQALYTTLA
jgi:hypothetical protein